MTDHRRDGRHVNEFAREIRAAEYGGTIPAEWNCRVIDLDSFYAEINDEVVHVLTHGKIWAWYVQTGSRVAIVALAELKTPIDPQKSWSVTKALAQATGIFGVKGYRIIHNDDGTVDATNLDGETRRFDSAYDFVNQSIRPHIAETIRLLQGTA